MADRTRGKTGNESSPEAVKELLLADQRRWEAIKKQRLQSVRDLSTPEILASIRSLNLADDGNDRTVLPGLFLVLAQKDPSRLLEMLNELPGEYYKSAISEAFPYLAKEHPEILQEYVLLSDFMGKRDRWMMIGACEVLGKENPIGAVDFFEMMPVEKKQGPLGLTLLKQAASEEPKLVVEYLTSNRTSPYFKGLFRDVLYTVLVDDPSFALKLVSSYPEVQNTKLSAAIYTSMARKNPQLALEEMTRASPVVKLEMLSRLNRDNQSYFSMLFSEDPAKTIDLLTGMVPSADSSRLLKEASDRLSSLPDGPERDASVRSFAELIRPSDPEAADLWIKSLR